LKRNAAKPLYDAAGGRVLPDGSHVDFVLSMPGDHFEIVEDEEFDALESEWDSGAHFDAAHAKATWIAYEESAPYESHSARGQVLDDEDIEELDTIPEPALDDDDVTHVRAMPSERTWWEAAKRGLRIRPD
jgi:hypothetical protein